MPVNKQVEDAKSLIAQRLKNEKKLQEKFKALGQINPVLPQSEEEKQIKLYEDFREQEAVFGDEFSTLMMPLINDKNFVNQLLQYLSPEQIKDVVLNWVKYLPKLKQYEGQRISKIKFVEILEDLMAENISLKGLREGIKSHREMQSLNPIDMVNQGPFLDLNRSVLSEETEPLEPENLEPVNLVNEEDYAIHICRFLNPTHMNKLKVKVVWEKCINDIIKQSIDTFVHKHSRGKHSRT